jgi:hypothetical protein
MNSTNRTITLIILILVGLILLFMASGMVDATQDKLLNKMTKGATIEMGAVPSLRMYVSSTWRGVEVVAGIILLVSALALTQKKKWVFPVALTSLAALPIGSFYISLAYMVKTRAFAPAFTLFIVGLLAFWALIFLFKKGKEAWTLFVPLTLLGMIGTQAFAFAEHGLRGLYTAGKTASITDPAVAILRYSGPIMGIVVILLFAAIYLLAAGKESGWWIALVAGLSMAWGAIPVHLARPKASMTLPGATPSIFNSTYLLGGVLGIILVIVLFLPYIKNQFVTQED